MFTRKKGKNIVSEIGKVHTRDDALRVFETKMTADQVARIQQIGNSDVLITIANAVVLCEPESVFVHTGSDADKQFIRELAIKKGEEKPLPMPRHTIHYDLKEEQGRIVDRTFYISNDDEEVSSLANRMSRENAMADILKIMKGIMRNKIMLAGFFVRGPIGSPVSNPALEITSSAYVMHSADILYRHAYTVFDKEVNRAGYFYTNIHSEGLNRPQDLPNARVFMDRSFQTTYSFNCTYAGNTLLMKKGNHRFSVDRAVYENKGNELSEHMFITGINSDGQITWVAGAAPSGCGKTTTAMAGDYFIGDDLAQMWIADDGSVRAINPECGIFGIVEDVNQEGDPKLMELLRQPKTEVIWSNVLIDETGTPHWTGNGEEPPTKGFNYQGEWVRGKMDEKGKPVPISHPNARCTLTSSALANYSDKTEDPKGVDIRVITYSGRDSDTMPPLWVADTIDMGVAIGASIVSAATATEVGATGVKRSPWANAQFIPGALGDYMDTQFTFLGSPRISDDKRPVIAGLNYFLTHEARGGSSKKLLGEKRDVKVWLGWLVRKARRNVSGILTPIGYIPKYEELFPLFKSIINKDYPKDLYLKQFSLYTDNIIARIDLQLKAFGKEARVPSRFFDMLNKQRNQLMALKEKFGPIVAPDQAGL